MKSKSKLLIVKTSAFGDVVQTFYVINDITEQRKDLELYWCVDERFSELATLQRSVRKVIPIPMRAWRGRWFHPCVWLEIYRWVRDLRSIGFSQAIDLQGMYKSALICWLSGASRRVGRTRFSSAEGFSQYLHSERYDLKRVAWVAGRIRDFVARTLAYDYKTLPLGSGLSQWKGPGEGVVLVIGASRKEKKWPIDNWCRLVEKLKKEVPHDRLTIIWGTEAEERDAKYLATFSETAWVPSKKKAPLALEKVFLNSKLVIGTDTGPTHLAAALGVPVLMLFGVTNPKNYSHPDLLNLCTLGGDEWPSVDQAVNLLRQGAWL